MKSERNKTIRFQDLDTDFLYQKIGTDVAKDCNVIVHGDALSLLKKIDTASIDLILTDPPYNLNKNYAGNIFYATDMETYENWVDVWMKECQRVLKQTGSIYVCCDWKSSPAIFAIMNKYFIMKNRITREREKGRGASTNWKNNIEDVYFAVKDEKEYTFNLQEVKVKKRVIAPYKDQAGNAKDRFTENGENYRMTCPSNIWTDITIPFRSMPENTEHPTQKPEKVIAKIIMASSNVGDIVLDPFLGSGTTAVVAKKLGRKYIGIEKEKEYCVVAQYRIDMADHNVSIQGIDNGVFLERNIVNPQRNKNILHKSIHKDSLFA